jgi:hypothetical protein
VLALAGASAVVLVLSLQLGDPAHWQWIAWEPEAPANVDRSRDGEAVRDSRSLSAHTPAGRDQAGTAIAGADVPPIEVEPVPPPKPPARGELYPGVRRDYLDLVRDDTVFLPDEADAWFHLFDVLRQRELPALEPYSLGEVSYVQLDQQPQAYRGQVVSLRGIVRGAKLIEAPINAFNVSRYYQLWLQSDRSSPELEVVYCLGLPEGFPLGGRIEEPVSLTAIFYKRWTYSSREGLTTAPLLAAKTVDWTPARPTPPTPRPPVVRQVAIATLSALALTALALVFIFYRTRTSRKRYAAPSAAELSAALSGVEELPESERRGTPT